MTTSSESEKVLINGKIRIYRDKAPYIKSGKSILGAIEYDERTDSLKCHECGEMHPNLARHIFEAHNETARDYKLAHGLNRRSALIEERTRFKLSQAAIKDNRAARITAPASRVKQLKALKKINKTRKERASAEMLNSRYHCKAQLLRKFQDITTTLGHTPSSREMKEFGLTHQQLQHHFGSLSNAAKLAKLAPNKMRPGPKEFYSREQLLKIIRDFEFRVGHYPTASDMRRHMFGLPSQSAFIRCFGSLSSANRMARRKTA